MSHLRIHPCLDSDELAEANRRSLDVDRLEASGRGMAAVQIGKDGRYRGPDGQWIDLQDSIEAARQAEHFSRQPLAGASGRWRSRIVHGA